ncbi:GNAT family N-acetyltransferase [Caenimonas koreensis]|uniref:GNAT family N-acetyltransferase n=1 Tax=Caenimonas koreensis DSM 17982 TaxID=1121255 RepID=A0A844B995_9BURK|nr:GNAT family N-acetyltransferase [Caenimonas koreensis]MRD48056.1 GNAT family N-acetyltransferase [Caenimonas koreensis DSM 17982]
MSIRPITPADIPALFHVRPRTRENALTLDELRALGITPESVATWLEGSTCGWLWQTPAGEVVGFCMAEKDAGELLVIALLPEYEGRGIGGQLMQHAESWLAQSGRTRAWLTTDIDPTLRAYGFYRHRGWTDWKIERGMRWMEITLPTDVER